MGARKGGLGATRVKTNFAEIEEKAMMVDAFKEAQTVESKKPLTVEEEIETVQSVRLAYIDLSNQKSKEEEKLKNVNPEKAKQLERLGMGFNLKGYDLNFILYIFFQYIPNMFLIIEEYHTRQ